MAPAIGRYEYGGGICQVSSTLYVAMCDALLPVTERHPHSSGVSYIPSGMDATISEEGHKDLQFVNIGQNPLRIETETKEGTITVSLYLDKGEQGAGEENSEEEIVGPARDPLKKHRYRLSHSRVWWRNQLQLHSKYTGQCR